MRCIFISRRTGNRRGTLSLAVLALLSVPVRVGAQQSSAANAPDRSIKVNVDLVVLQVTVTDPKGMPYPGLKASNFRLLDNDTEQSLQHFSTQDVPFSMGLLLDRSGSMAMIIEDVYKAAFHTVRASKPNDEFFIATFNEGYELRQDFTTNQKLLEKQLKGVFAGGQTALYDSIFTSIRHVKKGVRDKKALLIITDGADNSSKLSFRDLLDLAREEDVAIYAVGLFDMKGLFAVPLDEQPAVILLTRLAGATGGQAYFPRTMKECEEVCIRIAQELRQQYALGYYPQPKVRDGKWHAVQVQLQLADGLAGNGLKVKTRPGYLAPRD